MTTPRSYRMAVLACAFLCALVATVYVRHQDVSSATKVVVTEAPRAAGQQGLPAPVLQGTPSRGAVPRQPALTTRTLTVTCVRDQDGRPIPGATVVALRAADDPVGLPPRSDEAVRGTTDEHGNVALLLPARQGWWQIVAFGGGHVRTVGPRVPADAGSEPASIVLRIPTAISVGGTVTTRDGQPLEGVRVLLLSPSDPTMASDSVRLFQRDLPDEMLSQETTTDGAGRFMLYGMPNEPNRVTVDTIDHVVTHITGLDPARTVTRDTHDLRITVALRRYLRIALVDSRTNEPAPAATVRLDPAERDRPLTAPEILGSSAWSLRTGGERASAGLADNEILARVLVDSDLEDARFTLSSPFLEPALVRTRLLRASDLLGGGPIQSVGVTWRDGVTGRGGLLARMAVPTEYSLASTTNRPKLRVRLGGSRVAAVGRPGEVTEVFLVGEAVAPGQWRFRSVPAGVRTVQLELAGLRSSPKSIEIEAGATTEQEFEFAPPTGVWLTVRERGAPVLDAIVSAEPIDGLMGMPVHLMVFPLDRASRAPAPAFLPLMKGKYRLVVLRSGSAATTQDVEVLEGQQVRAEVALGEPP